MSARTKNIRRKKKMENKRLDCLIHSKAYQPLPPREKAFKLATEQHCSNRAAAKLLGLDEKTVRQDKKTLESHHPLRNKGRPHILKDSDQENMSGNIQKIADEDDILNYERISDLVIFMNI